MSTCERCSCANGVYCCAACCRASVLCWVDSSVVVDTISISPAPLGVRSLNRQLTTSANWHNCRNHCVGLLLVNVDMCIENEWGRPNSFLRIKPLGQLIRMPLHLSPLEPIAYQPHRSAFVTHQLSCLWSFLPTGAIGTPWQWLALSEYSYWL